MCACLEQMPTVSSSDCTETSVKDTFDFTYNQGSQDFTATLVSSRVKFDACTDADDNEIGLAEKYDQLKDEIEVGSDVPFSDYIVGDGNCGGAIDGFLETKGIARVR